jgi:hypothetical protein
MESKFGYDHNKEVLLGKYLDTLYPTLFPGYAIERITGKEQQHRGIDLVISKDGKRYLIDEKAQLDYTGTELPTFAFEVSYMKEGRERQGWLLDKEKLTEKYFLITGIYLNDAGDINNGFKSCKITSVDRVKLTGWLAAKGLDHERIMMINDELRAGSIEGRININELRPNTEGRFHYSRTNKAEQPVNIVLNLENLVKEKIAKVII